MQPTLGSGFIQVQTQRVNAVILSFTHSTILALGCEMVREGPKGPGPPGHICRRPYVRPEHCPGLGHCTQSVAQSVSLVPAAMHTWEGSFSSRSSPKAQRSHTVASLPGSGRASRAPWPSSSLSFRAEIQSTLKKIP